MSSNVPPDELWNGDLNEAAVEEWTETTTVYERVREVLLATSTPQSAGDIADRARVSESAARKHLDNLSSEGVAEVSSEGRGKQYRRSPQHVALRRITDLHEQRTRAEIQDAIEALQSELNDLRETHGATDVDELVQALEAGDDGWDDVARWRHLETSLDVARAALNLYGFEPGPSSGGGDATESGASRDSGSGGEGRPHSSA